jgi:hypothetical protein
MAGPALVVLGLVCFAALSGPPIANLLASQDWPATRCMVESSKVRSTWVHSHHGSFMLFWPDVRFHYTINGLVYRSNQYNSTDFQTPWYYGKRGITDSYPVGAAADCYVDPQDPTQAVLTRHLAVTTPWLLWPLIVIVLGVGVWYEGAIGRNARLGSAFFWRRAGIWLAAGLVFLFFLSTVSDLDRDWQAGTAEWLEILVVAALAILSLLLLHLALKSSLPRRLIAASGRSGSQGVESMSDEYNRLHS